MIAIVDYGMGNIASVRNALQKLGHHTCISDDPQLLEQASHLILPGVGSFQAAVEEINKRGLREVLQKLAERKPVLGICLGMHLLFSEGLEGGRSQGLDLIPGQVEKIKTDYLLPHIGWNQLKINEEENMFRDFHDKHVYFVHSYQAKTLSKYVVATAEYDNHIPAIVQNDHVFGMQFHPEKSGKVGYELIKTFLEVR
jgi:imidazole glycerol-phosphate synthase subunit HisH